MIGVVDEENGEDNGKEAADVKFDVATFKNDTFKVITFHASKNIKVLKLLHTRPILPYDRIFYNIEQLRTCASCSYNSCGFSTIALSVAML